MRWRSLMDEIGVRGGAAPEVQEQQIARIMDFTKHVEGLRAWKKTDTSG